MTNTTYYNLNIVEGRDIVNPLIVDNPNYEKIDKAMHDNAVSGVTLATEIANATVHAITRENSECAVIRFIATSNWKAGDTVTVDGVPVTALLPSGETLPDGAYVINANVLCVLTGTNLTIYAERKKTENANEIAYNDTTVGSELDKLNNLMSQTVLLWETRANTGSKQIDLLQYKFVLIIIAVSGFVTQNMLKPIYLKSFSFQGTQTQVGVNTPTGYVSVNFTYDGTTFSFSSDSTVLLDLVGIN